MLRQTTNQKDVLQDLADAIEARDMQDLFTTIQAHMSKEDLVIPFEYLQSFVQAELVILDWNFPEYYRNRLSFVE